MKAATVFRFPILFLVLFISIFETIKTECGGDLPGPFGELHSPNFPDYYGSNLNCTWTIKSKFPNDRIIVETNAFDVNDTNSAQCKDTYVKIGDKGTSLHTYCDDNRPYHALESMTNEVVIHFVTSAKNHTSRGFLFMYRMIEGVRNTTTPSPPISGCGGDFSYHSMGLINSPNYPEPYGRNLNCTWTIRGHNPTDEIEMKFDMFQIKDSNKRCVNNYLLVVDFLGSQHGAPLRSRRYCNEERPPVLYISKTNSVMLKLVTDDKNHTSAGFTLVYVIHKTNRTITTTVAPIIVPAESSSGTTSSGGWKIAFGVLFGCIILIVLVDLFLCRKRRGCMYSVCRKNLNSGYGNFR